MNNSKTKHATREPQYMRCVELQKQRGLSSLGLGVNQLWHDDPRHLVFLFARYKFVSKMFSGMGRVLEVGCGDAFGARLVQQEVKRVTATDFDAVFIADAKARMDPDWPFDARVHDMTAGPLRENFDGIYSLDVIEHVPKSKERAFLGNMAASLADNGVLIIGTPSLESQAYASPPSKIGHINCKNHKQLKALLSGFFHNVFIFSMNDEVVHTGFSPMAHYLFAICCFKKPTS